MDQVTEVSDGGCLQQLKNAIAGVVIAPILMIASCGALFWNEGRAVKRARDLSAGRDAVVALQSNEPDPQNDGKLVHTTGELSTGGPVEDSKFGVSADAVRLERNVEMFQWTEDEEKEKFTRNGETRTKTTYTYRREWSSRHHDSSRFHKKKDHTNPPSIPFENNTFRADEVTLGGFTVDRNLLDKLHAGETLKLSDSAAKDAPGKYAETATVSGGELFLNGRPSDPKVGDVRVHYSYVPTQTVSVVAGQSDGALAPYSSEDLYDTIGLIEPGTQSADGMFETAEEANQTLTWAIRAGGFIALLIAFMMLFSPLQIIAGAVPLVGWIIDDMVEAGTFLISLLLSVTIWTLVVGLGWIAYRPLIGIPLMFVALCGIAATVFAIFKAAQRRKAES